MDSPNRFLVTGGTGLIGGKLCSHLAGLGYDITVLTRQASAFQNNTSDSNVNYCSSFDELDATASWLGVINLAGESLGASRWNEQQKQLFIDSRIEVTEKTNTLIKSLGSPPKVYISASAIGWYGHWGDEQLTETSTFNEGFSHSMCSQWEHVANECKDLCRVCNLRIGIVLDKNAGALKELLPAAKLGLGGPIGSGKQWWSWIHIDDLICLIERLCFDAQFSGAINATAPTPVTQVDFAKQLGKQLNRPAFLPMPGLVAQLIIGEFAKELLLNGQRVMPQKLLDSGFVYKYPTLEPALKHLLDN